METGEERTQPLEVTVMNAEDILGRLIDHLEETKRLIDESRSSLEDLDRKDLVEILHECEQSTRTQIHLLTRAAIRR